MAAAAGPGSRASDRLAANVAPSQIRLSLRMFKITFGSEEGEGDLDCPFCEKQIGLPFGIQLRGTEIDPSPSQVINEHYDPGIIEEESVAIERCPNWNSWRTSAWELHDLSSQPTLLQAGQVVVGRNGTIDVTTTASRAIT